MSLRRLLMLSFTLAILAVLLMTNEGATAQTSTQSAPPYRLIGYYSSYSLYTLQYYITDIPANQLTDINYGPISISSQAQCVSADVYADAQYKYTGDKDTERLRGNFKQLQLLKKDRPNLQTLVSVGGWEQSKNFSNAVSTKDSRIRLAKSCIAFMRDNGFDGIDLDWRYPVSGGRSDNSASPSDSDNLTAFLQELRGQIEYWAQHDNKRYLLSITMPAAQDLAKNFQLDQLPSLVDWINVTTYGYQGDWSTVASHAAPLYPNTKDPRGEALRRNYNVAGTVKAYLDAGVAANKIVIGVPFYGQAWANVKTSDLFGLYQPADGVPGGTHPGGILYFRDLAPLFTSEAYTRYFDDETKAAWMYNAARRIAISYEDPVAIQFKADYIRTTGLGGMMVMELGFDDPGHTLLNAAYNGLNPATATGTPHPIATNDSTSGK